MNLIPESDSKIIANRKNFKFLRLQKISRFFSFCNIVLLFLFFCPASFLLLLFLENGKLKFISCTAYFGRKNPNRFFSRIFAYLNLVVAGKEKGFYYFLISHLLRDSFLFSLSPTFPSFSVPVSSLLYFILTLISLPQFFSFLIKFSFYSRNAS